MKQNYYRAPGLLPTTDKSALQKTPNLVNIQAGKLDANSKPSVKRLLNQKQQPSFIAQQSDQTGFKEKLL